MILLSNCNGIYVNSNIIFQGKITPYSYEVAIPVGDTEVIS